ncbi:MAG: hypothetical protein JWP57_2874 [Spirosoma sp.]|nr:hypothetical protein [Spirosoma sp.]
MAKYMETVPKILTLIFLLLYLFDPLSVRNTFPPGLVPFLYILLALVYIWKKNLSHVLSHVFSQESFTNTSGM